MRILNHKTMVAPDCAAPPCGERLGWSNILHILSSLSAPAGQCQQQASATDQPNVRRRAPNI